MKNLQLILEGLNCAHCGSKIEEKVGKLPNVETSSLNFINKTLTIEYDDIDDEELYNKIDKIVQKTEPGVIVEIIKDEVPNLNTCSSNENSCSCCGHHDHHEHHEHYELQKNSVQNKNKGVNHSHNHDNKNASKLLRIIIGGIIFSIAVFVGMQENFKISLLITSYIILGYDILLKAFRNIKNGQVFDENFLMAVASLGALIIGEHPEAAGVMLFYQVGEYLQEKAVDNSRKSIKGLLDIKPEYANLKKEGNIIKVLPEEVKIGDIIIVKPGEKVPLDGIVIDGSSSIDKSALTGESMTVDIFEGNEILSGSINLSGVLTIKVSKIFKESTVSRILYLVEKASNQKAKAENFITKFARYYTPLVVLLAVIIGFIPPLLIEGATFSDWIYKGLIFLVVSCPCALVLSIPLTYFGGIGSASKQGILIKGSNYLEALSAAEIVVFDKTGTLTEGSFEVTEVKAFNDFTKENIIKTAAYAELYSNHPIALSIKNKYNNKIDSELIKEYKEIPGYGITAIIDNKQIIIGNSKIMEKEKIDMISVGGKPGTIVYLAIDKIFAGYILINDKIKSNTKNLVENLKKLGISKTVMLTGDNNITAKYVGDKLKIDEYYAELLPQEKVEMLEKIFKDKKENGKLIFIGDGINDAPVLVRSDIGIAMGGVGSDAAIEASDIVIMADEPEKVCQSIKIANKTKRIVWQNIIFAIGIKVLVMILSVLGVATMPQAVFADVGVALIAVLNATRILRI